MSTTGHKRSIVWVMPKEELGEIVSSSLSYGEVLKKMGFGAQGSNHPKIKKRIEDEGIDVSHFEPFSRPQYETDEMLCENSTYQNKVGLRNRILKEGLIKYCCSGCGNTGEWNGKPLTLQLHHKNGVNNDHRIENLEFLCPNCHTQTDNYCGKNINK